MMSQLQQAPPKLFFLLIKNGCIQDRRVQPKQTRGQRLPSGFPADL